MMISLLLAGWAAAADPTYERLFGEADPAVAAVVEVGPTVPMWIWPAMLLGLGVVAASRLRSSLPHKAVNADLTILHRQSAGDRSTLLVVEVADGHGVRRRLLVGTGTGAPALVADLGSVEDGGELAEKADAPAQIELDEDDAPARASFAAALAAEVLAERDPPATKPRYFADEDLAPLPNARPPRLPRDPVMAAAPVAASSRTPVPSRSPAPIRPAPELSTPLLSTAPPRIALPPRVAPAAEARVSEHTDIHRRFLRARIGRR